VAAITGPRSRRAVLRAGAATGLAALLGAAQGCGARFGGTRLTLGTGGSQGVYYTLGGALADAWHDELRLAERPTVRTTAGSVDNLQLLAAGAVDVIFATADVADTALTAPGLPRRAPVHSPGSTTTRCRWWCRPTRRSPGSPTCVAGGRRWGPPTPRSS
jgi:uncharacterized protein